MPNRSRQRVSIDLRGIGDRLNSFAAKRAVTGATAVRTAVLTMLDAQPEHDHAQEHGPTVRAGPMTKVTLRVSASHASVLSDRSRAACVSLGDYVCGLLDQLPPQPLPVDHHRTVKVLHASTDRLATLANELRALLREVGPAKGARLDDHLLPIARLTLEVRQHLLLAAQVLQDLRPLRKPSSSPSDHSPNEPS